MNKRITIIVFIIILLLTACSESKKAANSEYEIQGKTASASEELENSSHTIDKAMENKDKVIDFAVGNAQSEATTKESESGKTAGFTHSYEEDDDPEYDQEEINRYLSLSQKQYDEAPVYEDNLIFRSKNDELILVKLAEYEEDHITVYGILSGVIISYQDKKEFFPCKWVDLYTTHKVGLCDIDDDESKELILVTNSGHGNMTNIEALRVFKFENDNTITLYKFSEEDAASLLGEKIRYDKDKKAVLVLQDSSIVKEIPLSAYERDSSYNDSDMPLAKRVESIFYDNSMWYEITDKSTTLDICIYLNASDQFMPLLPLDENGDVIDATFSVTLKDGIFELECIK